LRGRKDTLALVYFYWRGDRPPRPLGIDATAKWVGMQLSVYKSNRLLSTGVDIAIFDPMSRYQSPCLG